MDRVSTPGLDAEVIVVGGGTAGAATAYHCAKGGLSTICLEQSPLDTAGAQWANGVPRWLFTEAGVQVPEFPELRSMGGPFHLVAGWGLASLRLVDQVGDDLMEVDMRGLVARLQGLAVGVGARFLANTRVSEVRDRSDRIEVETHEGVLRSRWLVDASGLPGVTAMTQPVSEDLCAAAQQVRSVANAQTAKAFFASHGAMPGEALCFTGVSGGFSIVNVRLEVADEGESAHQATEDQAVLSLLTGSLPGRGFESGSVLLKRFVESHSWIGPRLFGGSRAIPIGGPDLVLCDRSIARVGDVAGQVFAAHGSGIGAGLMAARLLGETLSSGGTPWDYNCAWQRRWGGLFASSAHFADFSSDLTAEDLRRLMNRGLIRPNVARQGMMQRPVKPGLVDLLVMGTGIVRAPRLMARMAPVLQKMLRLEKAFAGYPSVREDVDSWADGIGWAPRRKLRSTA